MANVLFKRGRQANLPKSDIIDGAFYLTTDTNRLYVGNNTELVELNKSITVVESVDKLPKTDVEVGQFYYIAGTNKHAGASDDNGNILAVVTSITNGVPHWTQVNPDTVDGNDRLGDVAITKGNYDAVNNVIPYTLSFSIKDKDGKVIQTITKTLNVAPKDIISKADISVSTSSAEGGNAATITTQIKDTSNNNALSPGSSFSIAGGDNVTVTQKDGVVTIATGIGKDSVQMHVDGTNVQNQVSASVRVDNGDRGDVLKIAGDTTRDIGIVWDAANKVAKIGHSNSAATAATGDAIQLSHSSKSFTAVTSTTYDNHGHISAQTSQQVTLPSYAIKDIKVDDTDKSKLKVSLTDQNGTAFGTATSGSILYNTITVYDSVNGTATKSTIANQGDIGTFYSKTAIDNMMKGLDALTYKGTVATNSDLPKASKGVHIGDTYKVSAENSGITINGKAAQLGDLLIAIGTEDSNGNITSDTLAWTLVQGNSETDTTYDMKVAAGSGANSAKVGILASTDAGNFNKFATITGDGVITVTPTAGEGKDGAVAFAHANSGATAGTYGSNNTGTVAPGDSIVIPAVTVNAAGHVTGISNATMTLPGENKLGINTNNKSVKLQNASGKDLGVVQFADGNLTSVTVEAGGSGVAGVVTVSHAVPTMGSDATSTQAVNLSSAADADRQISVISGVTKDSYGHVTALATKTITLGRISDSLSQSASAGTNAVTIGTQLKDYAGTALGKSDITLASAGKSVTITPTIDAANNSTSVNLEIVWGSF